MLKKLISVLCFTPVVCAASGDVFAGTGNEVARTGRHIYSAEEFLIEHLDSRHGISHGCVSCILQDSQGFIWFGTEGGLNRYDGYSIKEYTPDPDQSNSLSSGFIRTLYQDPADSGRMLWIGTKGGGLNRYDSERDVFTSFMHNPDDPASLSDNDVRSIFKDSDGVYWIGTEKGVLNRFDHESGRFTAFHHDSNDQEYMGGGTILSICEDGGGDLWFAAVGFGLIRFDRRSGKFIRYRHDPGQPESLPTNEVLAVHFDSGGVLWIGTKLGLGRFDPETERFVRPRFLEGDAVLLENSFIWRIYEDAAGELWIATHRPGLFRINRNRDRSILFEHDPQDRKSLSGNTISSVYRDRSGIVWVGTYCNGLNKLVPQRTPFMHLRHIPGDTSSLADNWVLTLYQDRECNLWIGTNSGLEKWDRVNSRFRHYVFSAHKTISCIHGAEAGQLWIARNVCLTRFDPRSGEAVDYGCKYSSYPPVVFSRIDTLRNQKREIASIQPVGDDQHITRKFHLPERISVLVAAAGESYGDSLVDRGWLESSSGGPPVWKMEMNETRHAGGGYGNRVQLAVIDLSPGEYLLKYRSNSRHSCASWTDYPPADPGLWGISAYALSLPQADRIREQLEVAHCGVPLGYKGGGELSYVYQDRSGAIWCIVKGGELLRFDLERSQFIPQRLNDDPAFLKISVVFQDDSGALWFGSSGEGLIKYTRSESGEAVLKKFRHDPLDTHSISGDYINTIYQDGEGILWIGTDTGLNRYDPGTGYFSHFREKEGMPSDFTYGILEHDNGCLWISTNKGLTRFDPRAEVFKNYTVEDGLQGNVFGPNAYCKGNDGVMYFGGMNGITAFHPDSLKGNQNPPVVAINDFQIFNKSISPGDDSPLSKTIERTSEIVLSHNQDVFSFGFTALDFTEPAKNQYAYQMMGVDPDWVYTDASRRFATYTRLAPGKYTFRIKASNNDGVWNENGLSVRIVITPPWWRTVWAYALYLLLFVSVIYASYRFLLNRARTRQLLRFEHLEAEKLRDLDRMKSQFFANISHEFRTPLTLILGPVEKLLAKTGDAKVRQDLSMVLRNARRLQRLISQLLDLSRLEAGKMSLHTREEDVVALVKQYVQHFESQATIKGINLRFSAAAGPIRAYIDREKIENIVYNLVSNAFKFTPGDGEINVSVAELPLSRADSAEGVKFDCRHGSVKIAVRDTGCGIRADRIGRIFDRFFKADDSTTREHEGTGIGLALTRELVELHKGKISVRSVEGRGSTFIVLLPLGKDHLKAGEIAAEPADHLEGTGLGESAMVERVRKKSITRLNGAEGEYTVSAGGGQKPGARSTRKSAIILIIEDNADLRAYIRDILYSENRILEAADGAQGLDAAVESIPDLIISDVVMPRMDGFELCRRLKTDERSSHIPVILLTARASGESKLTGLETGADDYIIKPFDSRELSARVKNLIEQRRKLRERFSQAVTLKPSEIAVTSADEKFLRRAIDIIENHLSDADFRVDQFGREIGLSRVQLHRKLRALTGKSATGFIRAIRLQRAVVLLEHRYGNISEIAYEVGFSKPSYFAECFRKQFGCLPSEYTGRDN